MDKYFEAQKPLKNVTEPSWCFYCTEKRDQEQAGESIRHPLNHDRSNAGVIRSKRTVKLCLGVKRTYNFVLGANGTCSEERMSDVGVNR